MPEDRYENKELTEKIGSVVGSYIHQKPGDDSVQIGVGRDITISRTGSSIAFVGRDQINTPKILYVEDELTANIPRLVRLFDTYLDETERKRLEELEGDQIGFGATQEEIQQIFKENRFIDIEYRFPDALAKILKHPDIYTLFIIDRNLAGAEYTFEEVLKIDHQYSQTLHERFHEREGDYLLLKLALHKKIDVREKFYFLTAYSVLDELRGASEIESFIDLGEFHQQNFIEKGNNLEFERLHKIVSRHVYKPDFPEKKQTDAYVFYLRDGSTVRGTFGSPVLRFQTPNGKTSLDTKLIRKITRLGSNRMADFTVESKDANVLQGRILDKKISVHTQIAAKYEILSENIQSVEIK